MIWINLNVAIIREAVFVDADPIKRATWLNVLAYCIEQENGGRIRGARLWGDRQWMRSCAVTLEEVRASEPLISLEGDDLIVWRYPLEKEHEVRTNRKNGKKGGKRSAEARLKHSTDAASGDGEPPASSDGSTAASSDGSTPASTEGNGREGWNGMEGVKKKELSARERALGALPDSLQVDPFLSAWSSWIDYLIDRNHGAMVPLQTLDEHLRTCARLGATEGAAALRAAMAAQLRRPLESSGRKNFEGGAVVPFDPTQPHAHTEGSAEVR